MRSKIATTLIVVMVIVSAPFQALGQATATREAEIQQLKAEIQRRESLERDETIPPDLKEKNRQYLAARQTQLRTLLQAKIAALQKYKTTLGSDLTSEERQLIDGSMQAIETELQSLGQQARRNTPDAATVFKAPTALERPVAPPSPELAIPSPVLGPPSDQPPSSSPPAPPPASPPAGVTTSASLAESANTSRQTPSPQTPQDCSLYNDNPKTFSLYDKYVCDLARIIKDNKTNNRSSLFSLGGPEFFNLTVLLMAKKLRTAYIIEAEEARVDKQVGSGSSSAGSTSLVIKGGAPAILGFAVENGALSQSSSGTTITFRGNPVGIIKALANKGFVEGYDEDSAATRALRKASFAFSFDTQRGQTPGTFTADRQQLSAYSVRYEIYNKRDPRDRSYKKDWEDFLVTRAQTFVRDFARFRDALTEQVGEKRALKDPALQDWLNQTIQTLNTTAVGNVETALNERLNALPLTDFSAETVTDLEGFAREFGVYLEGRDRILDRVAKGGIITFEYSNNRQINAPNLSNFMLIAETSFGGKADLTANASLTIFDNLPRGVKMSRLRDFQFATQLDAPFNVQGIGKFVLSFAGKYQRLTEDAMTPAGMVIPGSKGDIAVGQLKLTIPAKFGIKLPISVSFANRTELIKERDVRGNIGITFDFDSIFARFKK